MSVEWRRQRWDGGMPGQGLAGDKENLRGPWASEARGAGVHARRVAGCSKGAGENSTQHGKKSGTGVRCIRWWVSKGRSP